MAVAECQEPIDDFTDGEVPEELRAYTVPVAAVGISEAYLRIMLKRGDIRCVKAGRRVIVPATSIREFLAPPKAVS